MEVFVYSRQALDAARPHEVPHVVISITSDVGDVAPMRANEMRRAILRLSFPDVEAASAQFDEDVLFSRRDAVRIWDFVRAHRSEVARVVIHCDAGVSRSAAVGAAIARVLNGDDAEFFGGRYRPNMRVYRTLLETAASIDPPPGA